MYNVVMIPIAILAIDNEEDRIFMQEIFSEHRRRMYAVAYDVLHVPQNVDDVVGDACIALIDKLALMRTLSRYALTVYIVVTVRNKAIDYQRKQERRNAKSFLDDGAVLDHIPGDQNAADANIIRYEEIARIKKGIDMLKEQDRRVLEMRYVQNMTHAEMAAELGIDKKSVPSRLQRVKRRAYAMLAGVMKDEDYE